jgi:hypothetical protein
MSETDSVFAQVSEKEGTNDRDEWFSTPNPAVPAPKSLSISVAHPALQKQHDPPHVPDHARMTERNKKQHQSPSILPPFASDSKRLSANTSLEKPNSVRLTANDILVNSTLDSRTTAVTHGSATSVQEALPANRSIKQQLTPVAVPIAPVDRIAQLPPPLSKTSGQVLAHPTTVETSVPMLVPEKIEPPVSNRQAKRLARKAAREEARKIKATESGRVSDPTSRAVRVKSPQPIVTSETDLAQATVRERSSTLRQSVERLSHTPGPNVNPVMSLDLATTADNRDPALNFKPGFRSVNVRVRSLNTCSHRG